jgi:hypothetical protein
MASPRQGTQGAGRAGGGGGGATRVIVSASSDPNVEPSLLMASCDVASKISQVPVKGGMPMDL